MFTRQKEEGWREAGEEELGGGKSCPEEGSVGVSRTLSLITLQLTEIAVGFQASLSNTDASVAEDRQVLTCMLRVTLTFSHLADALIQSDLQ